jgi:hypothetical protein
MVKDKPVNKENADTKQGVTQPTIPEQPPIQPPSFNDRMETLLHEKDKLLLDNERTKPGLPPTKGVKPPETTKAQDEAKAREIETLRLIKPPNWKPQDHPTQNIKRKYAKIEERLERGDWEAVASYFQHTASVPTLMEQTGLNRPQVNHLLHRGVQRLGLPSIKEHAINTGKINLDLAKAQKRRNEITYSTDVADAIQNRATQEAAAARNMLNQAIESGTVVSGYLKALFQQLGDGRSILGIPEVVTLDTLDGITKVVDAHTRALERSIKMVRLTQGEPTEIMEHQIGAMLAICSTKELEEAAATGRIPKRLTARISGADQVEESTSKDKTVIDVKADDEESTNNPATTTQEATPNPEEEPSWKKSIARAEGESSTAVLDKE